MPEVIFADPVGGPFKLAYFDEGAHLMETLGEEYWNSSEENGLASLTFCPEGWAVGRPQTARIDFTKKDGRGFHFYYVSKLPDGDTVNKFSCVGRNFDETVVINWAGRTREVFVNLFVAPEAALQVVQQFCLSGEPTDQILWIDSTDVPRSE